MCSIFCCAQDIVDSTATVATRHYAMGNLRSALDLDLRIIEIYFFIFLHENM